MNKTIIMFVLIAVIFFSAGMGAGILISGNLGKQGDSKFDAPDTFKAGWEAAKKKVEETPYIPLSVGEIKSIKGKITEVGSGRITIEARLLNPLDDERLKTRAVKINENTEIIIRQEKDRETIRQEHEAYNKEMQEFRDGKTSSMPAVPEVYIEKGGTIENLLVGQTITAESEENIREALEFRASKVLVR